MTHIHWDDWKYLNKILGEKPKPKPNDEVDDERDE